MDASDPERVDALEQYKRKLLESREQEAKLKGLRLDIKTLQGDFDTTEDNIKALQSVGQIIGEVLKQLDDERCKTECLAPDRLAELTATSHRQSFFGSEIRRRLSIQGRQVKAEAGNACGARHDDSNHHENAASRGRSSCLQHVSRGPRPSELCRDRWP